jgi:uncharacterized membrane protein YfcA
METVVVSAVALLASLGVYMTRFAQSGLHENATLVICATVSAFAGAYVGFRLLKKVTLAAVQWIVTIMLIILSLGLALGMV